MVKITVPLLSNAQPEKNDVKQSISSENKSFASRASSTVTDVCNLKQNYLPQTLYDDYKKIKYMHNYSINENLRNA